MKIDLSDEEKELIRYMAEHAYPVSSISNIYPIISDEKGEPVTPNGIIHK